MCDNTTAIYCINKMGTSHSMDCHYLTIRIWEWAIKSNIQLTSALMPEKQSIIADRETRVCHVDLEWMLSPRCLHQSLNLLSFKPDIDFLQCILLLFRTTFLSFKQKNFTHSHV